MEKFLNNGKPIKVKLVGTDGNAFALLGVCTSAARKAKIAPELVKAFQNEAMSGDYNHLLATCCDCFEVR